MLMTQWPAPIPLPGRVIALTIESDVTSAKPVDQAAVRIIPFAAFIAFIVLESVAGGWLRSKGLDTRWLYGARAVVVGCLLLAFWRHYTELHTVTGLTGARIMAAVAAGILVFVLWINLDQPWATTAQPTPFNPVSPAESGPDWVLVFFRLLGMAIIVPVMEELFWRSYLLRRIDGLNFLARDPRTASVTAILICSALFASEHSQWFAGLIAGLVYALIYIRTGNLWLPIISHAVTNAVLGGWVLATGEWKFW